MPACLKPPAPPELAIAAPQRPHHLFARVSACPACRMPHAMDRAVCMTCGAEALRLLAGERV